MSAFLQLNNLHEFVICNSYMNWIRYRRNSREIISRLLVETNGLSLTSGSGKWTGGNGCQDHWHSATGLAVRHANSTDELSLVSVWSGMSTNTTPIGVGFVPGIMSSMEWPSTSETTVDSETFPISPIVVVSTDSSAMGTPKYRAKESNNCEFKFVYDLNFCLW